MNLYLLFLIALCNMLSWHASRMMITLFALELGATPLLVGTMIATYSLFPLLLAFYAGKLSDRLGLRAPMLFGSAGIATGMVLPFLFPVLPALYASAAVIGASHVFYNVATQNLIGIFSNADTRTRNYNNFTLIASTATMLGPLAAGFSIDHFGHASSYLYLTAAPLLAASILFFSRELKQQRPRQSTVEGGQAGAGNLLNYAPLRRILITAGIVLTGSDLFQFYMPIYGHAIGLSASAIGIVVGSFAAASFVVRLVMQVMVKRWGEDAVFLWSILLSAAVYPLFPLFESAALLAVVAFMLGLCLGCSGPLTLTLTYERAPQGRSGEALGLRLTTNNLMHMVVPLLFGAVGTSLGVAPVFLANSLLLACGAMLVRKPGKT